MSTWEAFAKEELGSSDFARVGASFEKLNDHLTLRTFFVGHELSAADLAVFAALKASKVWLKNLKLPNIDAKYPHLVRWYNHLDASEEVRGKLAHLYAAPAPAAAKAADKGEAKKKDQGSFDIDLPGAERGKVVTRFPPEPSGYMHIGHAKVRNRAAGIAAPSLAILTAWRVRPARPRC